MISFDTIKAVDAQSDEMNTSESVVVQLVVFPDNNDDKSYHI